MKYAKDIWVFLDIKKFNNPQTLKKLNSKMCRKTPGFPRKHKRVKMWRNFS